MASSPFFEIGAEGFLLRTPNNGRLHYAAGQGVSQLPPPGRGADDLAPFVSTAVFGAAAWIDGQIPLRANALRLHDGRLLLIAGALDYWREELAVVMADMLGLAAAAAPVVVTPDSPARACTNGLPVTLRPDSVTAISGVIAASAGPPVRAGAQCVPIGLPVIDGRTVHACAGLIMIRHQGVVERQLETLSPFAALPELRKHIFQPAVGMAIWGAEVLSAAQMLIAGMMPVLRLSVPADAPPDRDTAMWLFSQQDSWSK